MGSETILSVCEGASEVSALANMQFGIVRTELEQEVAAA